MKKNSRTSVPKDMSTSHQLTPYSCFMTTLLFRSVSLVEAECLVLGVGTEMSTHKCILLNREQAIFK